jgi:hypothetical protein
MRACKHLYTAADTALACLHRAAATADVIDITDWRHQQPTSAIARKGYVVKHEMSGLANKYNNNKFSA